jgi:anti-sigma factor RsiW
MGAPMACESWTAKLDPYLDVQLSDEEMRAFDAHLRDCPSCTSDALARVQMKRSVQVAGKRFTPSADFRKRLQKSIAPKPAFTFNLGWALASAAAVALIAAVLASSYSGMRANRNHLLSEVADLHVETLASSSPVDVISTDRHTVKPWFQGKIPFSFNLPEVQNSEFSLLGGRMTYLGQTPGAHLIYDVRKHHISVFIFPEAEMQTSLGEQPVSSDKTLFHTETWTQGGLRYFVIGDAAPADIHNLAKLFKS